MKTQSNIPSSFDDVVFENRNKLYGAYALRRSYNGSLLKAVLISSLILAVVLFLATRKWTQDQITAISVQLDSTVVEMFDEKPYKPVAEVKPEPARSHSASQALPTYSVDGQRAEQQLNPNIPIGPKDRPGDPDPGMDPDWKEPGDEGGGGPIVTTTTETSTPLRIVEENPEFPGGLDAMSKFLVKYLQKDDAWREMGLSGKVYVDFVVDKQGNVVDVKALNGPYELLKKTSERAIKAMPKWKPGRQNGHDVSVILTIPISFVIK